MAEKSDVPSKVSNGDLTPEIIDRWIKHQEAQIQVELSNVKIREKETDNAHDYNITKGASRGLKRCPGASNTFCTYCSRVHTNNWAFSNGIYRLFIIYRRKTVRLGNH